MARKSAAVVFLATVVLLAFVATTGESRHLRHVKRVEVMPFNLARLCENATKYSKICEKVAKASPDGIHVTSPVTLVEANVAAAIGKAQKASAQVAKLMKTSSNTYQGMMGSALSSCKESYDSTLDALQQSQTLLKDEGNHDDLMTQLSAASTFVTTCKDSLDEVGPDTSYPPQTIHSLLDKLVTNSLDLGAHLN